MLNAYSINKWLQVGVELLFVQSILSGPYDFDNSSQITDHLKIAMNETAEEQEYKRQTFREANRKLSSSLMGKTMDINHPGRLILYFLFDISRSVGEKHFKKSINFAKAIVKKVGISESGARAGAITFFPIANMIFAPVVYTTTEEVVDALDTIDFIGYETSDNSALTLVREEYIPLTQDVLGKEGQKSIVFILTDGRGSIGDDPQEEAKALKDIGVEIYCIGITDNVHENFLNKIASDEQHVFILENYATLPHLVQEITKGTIKTFCDFPEPLANGTILEPLRTSTNRTEFPYNSELLYVCDKGYRLEGGDSWRLYGSDGWSGVTPYCEVIHCPDPGSLENGAKEGNSYEIEAKVRFKCSNGYFLLGSFERHCMPNGQWTGELARCDTDTNYCPNPGIPINGFKNSTNYDMGDVVGFGCRQGYSHIGTEARVCMPDRSWSGTETRCIGPYDFDNSAQIRDNLKISMKKKADEQIYKLQKFPEAIRKPSSNPIDGILHNNHPGRLIFYFLFDVSESVGQDNFEKSIDFAKTIVKKVGISESGTRAGAITFSLTANMKFTPVVYTTTEEVVDALDAIDFTGYETSDNSALTLVREEYIPLTQVVLGREGQISIVFILTDGRGSLGDDPEEEAKALKDTGVEIYCIGVTDNVHKDFLNKIASDEHHVFILENYYSTLSHLVQGITNGAVETFCDFPEPLANGTILEPLRTSASTNGNGFPYNSELLYVCDKGYRLKGGDSWRLCDSDGWSGVTPYCEVIHCPDPGAPENGAKEGNSYKIGAKVRFKCSIGYFLLGSFERHCMPNGKWTGELARCDTDTNYCPNPGIPINGFKNSTNYDMGDVVGFGCRQGFSHIGSEARVCMPDQIWSGTETRCIGPYDFDNSAEIRDNLKIGMKEKADEQINKRQKFPEANQKPSSKPMGGILNINHPGRLILYFLFDVSGSVGPDNFERSIDFKKSINFATAIVKRVGISESGARAGALTFSSEADIKFLPRHYTTTERVIDALEKINFTGGGTSENSALTLVRTQCIPLTQNALGKKAQKSIVFILTDGKRNMVHDPQEEAKALKDTGVEIYCIGITDNVHKDFLNKIASDEQHVYSLENYATLSHLVQEITNGTIDYSECGLGLEETFNRIPISKIVGGSQAVEPWPWMVAVYFLPHGTVDWERAELNCGGSIISKFFILTAAHCMFAPENLIRDAQEVIVKLGLTHVKNETFVQEPEVKRFFVHPKYRPGFFYDYDIAILQLSIPIEYNAYVRPICLPPTELPGDSNLYKPKEYTLAIGWGHQGVIFKNTPVDLKLSENLKQVILPIQSREACNQSLLHNRFLTQLFTDRMFCAGEVTGGVDTCRGDSGGPLMQSQLNKEGYLYWTQVGIVSWGIGCGLANTYGYYSHVSRLRQWIDQQIKDALEVEI